MCIDEAHHRGTDLFFKRKSPTKRTYCEKESTSRKRILFLSMNFQAHALEYFYLLFVFDADDFVGVLFVELVWITIQLAVVLFVYDFAGRFAV